MDNMDESGIAWEEDEGIRYLTFPCLKEAGLSIHACTSRPFDLGFGRMRREEVIRSRKKICRVLGINFLLLTTGEQVHGTKIVKVGEGEKGNGTIGLEGAIRRTDGFISNIPDIPLGIFTADCIPIFILDPVKKAIGLVHAGWKGTLQGITKKVVQMMGAEYNSLPDDLIIAMGPSIGPCCYLVGEEVVAAFKEQFPDDWPLFMSSESVENGQMLDLAEANRIQLIRAKIKESHIINSRICTSCHSDVFFSYRHDGSSTGRMMSLMML